jgi:Amino acid synthesis
MQIDIRRNFTLIDSKAVEAGQRHESPIVHVMCGLVVANPYAGHYVEDLGEMIEASAPLGRRLGAMLVAGMAGLPIEGYGKAGVVGLGGELEHANALLTTSFANPVRDAIGGALAWIPSFTKRAAPGASIDVPMAHKDALYVRSHYDGMSVTLPPETPGADEVVLLFCAANRGRLNARVGGLSAHEISARDGLR